VDFAVTGPTRTPGTITQSWANKGAVPVSTTAHASSEHFRRKCEIVS